MPDVPDFDQIARRILLTVDHVVRDHDSAPGSAFTAIVEDLRQVWNLRGAADIAAIDEVAHTNETAVEAAIKQLDR